MQKLIIKNFRQIPYAEIDITKFTIFIGPQASGKSTIAKLIYFFKELPKSVASFVFNYNKSLEQDSFLVYKKAIAFTFSNYFLKTNHKVPFAISYSYNEKKSVQIIYGGEKSELEVHFNVDFETEISTALSFLAMEYRSVDFKIKEANDSGDQFLASSLFHNFRQLIREHSDKLFHQNDALLFVPASRNMLASKPEIINADYLKESTKNARNTSYFDDYLLLIFFENAKTISQEFHQSNPFTKNVKDNIDKYFVDNSEQIIKARIVKLDNTEYFVNEETSTPLQIASTGQQEVLRILQFLYTNLFVGTSSFNIIEEPEAHLFPEAQKHLIQLMALMANKTDSQVVITTHSPYILSVVNNLLYYSKVAQRNPKALEKIKERFGTTELDESKGERINLLREEVSIYSLGQQDAYCKSVIDEETGLISKNNLDDEFEELYEDFDFLYPLNRVSTEKA